MNVSVHVYLDHHFKSENTSKGIVQIFEHLQKRPTIHERHEEKHYPLGPWQCVIIISASSSVNVLTLNTRVNDLLTRKRFRIKQLVLVV